MGALAEIVRRRLLAPVEDAEVFADEVRRGLAPGEPEAIVLYGSCLSPATRTPTSMHDVYAIASRLRRFHGAGPHAALNAVLPPNVYYHAFERDGARRRCKVCVISAAQLARETSPRARDLHHLGRFSKRVALAWARDDDAAERALGCCVAALRTMAPLARARLPERFDLDAFAFTLLGLSYAAELRVAEDAKVAALFAAERDYYREAFAALLAEQPDVVRDGERYAQPPAAAARAHVERLLARSRRRERLRWPKYIVTFDGWLDYLLDKLERHQGVRVELSARERRFPLLFAWGKYFALRRKGIVK